MCETFFGLWEVETKCLTSLHLECKAKQRAVILVLQTEPFSGRENTSDTCCAPIQITLRTVEVMVCPFWSILAKYVEGKGWWQTVRNGCENPTVVPTPPRPAARGEWGSPEKTATNTSGGWWFARYTWRTVEFAAGNDIRTDIRNVI